MRNLGILQYIHKSQANYVCNQLISGHQTTHLGTLNNLVMQSCTLLKLYSIKPCGKESTEVQITQNKGKESENSYQKLKRSQWTGTQTHTQKQNQNILIDMAVLLNQKRANVCEHTTKMASLLVCSHTFTLF